MILGPENKNVVLFWLGRHLREVQARVDAPDQGAMAQAGLSYVQRQQMVEAADAARDSARVQLEAIKAAIRFIEETV